MRIIAGKWRGHQLAQPPQNITRPTTDRVREALFSMLTSRIGPFDGITVLDAFAGSGALGLEALSRGAKHVTFAEKDKNVRQTLIQNISNLQCTNSVALFNDVFKITNAASPFHLIFLDPPYGMGLEHKVIPFLLEQKWIDSSTLIILETHSTNIPSDFLALNCLESRTYGNCSLSFWKNSN